MAPTRLIGELKPLFSGADRLWDEGVAAARPGELSCRAGCYGCCVGLFEISMSEALLVQAGVAALPATEREDVLARAERLVRETASVFPGEAAVGVLDPERSEEEDDRYFDSVSQRACPMLELPSGRCRIYSYRPITCRTYGLAWKRGAEPVHPACPLNFVVQASPAPDTPSGRAAALVVQASPARDTPSGRGPVVHASPARDTPSGPRPVQASPARDTPSGRASVSVGGPSRADETAIDLDRLLANDQEMARLVSQAGLPGGAETTIAHAVVGTAFR